MLDVKMNFVLIQRKLLPRCMIKRRAVVISTRHDSHYELVLAALENRKDILLRSRSVYH